MTEPATDVRIGVILASVREGRRGEVYARWIHELLGQREGVATELLDLRDFALPPYGHAEMPRAIETRYSDDTARRWSENIHALDGSVIVTPEYNHGYPAALKELIDSAGEEWHAKPAAFVSYGGVSGGLRAVEQLRQVFAELHVVSIRDSVSFQNAWQLFDSTGCPADPDRCSAQMSKMLAKLHWWATALRTAREATPYFAAA